MHSSAKRLGSIWMSGTMGDPFGPPDEQTSTDGTGPPTWTPPPGWGTVRNYVVVRNDSGGVDVGCQFIPDDGNRSFPLIWRDVAEDSEALKGLGVLRVGPSIGGTVSAICLSRSRPRGLSRFGRWSRTSTPWNSSSEQCCCAVSGPFSRPVVTESTLRGF
jgi:hypothetical protein